MAAAENGNGALCMLNNGVVGNVFYLWRIVATGLCFALFGIGALGLSTVVLPVVALLSRDASTRKRRLQYTVHKSFRFFIGLMQASGILRLIVEKPERFSAVRNRLVIANHPSLIDVVILIMLFPEMDCIVKEALSQNRFLRGVVRAVGYLSNSDSALLLQQCVAQLQAGSSLLVFPEGTRTRPGQPLCFQRGVANIALRAGLPITPVFIEYVGSGLGKGDKWYKIPRHQPLYIRLWCGDDICLPPVSEPLSLASRRVTEQLQQFYQTELEQHAGDFCEQPAQ